MPTKLEQLKDLTRKDSQRVSQGDSFNDEAVEALAKIIKKAVSSPEGEVQPRDPRSKPVASKAIYKSLDLDNDGDFDKHDLSALKSHMSAGGRNILKQAEEAVGDKSFPVSDTPVPPAPLPPIQPKFKKASAVGALAV